MSIDQSLFSYIRERMPRPNEKALLEEIALGADVPYHTLLKIANGETGDPRISTVENLLRYFQAKEAA